MGNQSGGLIMASFILGIAVMGGAYMVSNTLGAGTEELAGVRVALADLQGVVKNAANAAARPAPTAARSRRPDPDRQYSVKTSGSPAKGPDDAKVTIVEFSDFQCPFCGRVTPTLDKVAQEYPDSVRVVFKHLPLRIHPKAPGAHAAAEAAHRQGKFWEMHDAIFENQREMGPEKYVEYAQAMGLDVERFKKDVASPDVKKKVDRDAAEAGSLGVSGTPSFFINGRYFSGAQPYEEFKKRIDEALAKG